MAEETHWGPDPGHGGLTQHKGLRADCSGPDCGSDEGSHFHQATQRLDASDWQWQEGKPKGAMREAVVAQVHSNLAVAFELRRSNDSRDQFYTEVLDLLVRITEDPMAGPKSETRCSAMRGPNSWDQCVNPAGHRDQRLHVDEAGIAFSEDLSESLRSGQPAATPDGQEGREGE